MKFLFVNIYGTGHVNPSLELVKQLVVDGAEVVYFTHPRFGEKLKSIGAVPMTYGDGFTLGNYSEKKRFPSWLFPGAVFGMLPILLDYIRHEEEENGVIDGIIFDAFAIAGYFAAKILHKPAIRSSSSFPGGYHELSSQFYAKEDPEVLSAISELEKTYSLVEGTDFFAPYEDCLQERADSVLSVVYTVEHLQPPVKQLQHGKFCFVGCSVPNQLPALHGDDKDLFESISQWKQQGTKVVYISLGTVASLSENLVRTLVDGINMCKGDYRAVLTGFSDSIRTTMENADKAVDFSLFLCTPFAPQLHILSIADVFISHCGMNSLNESLYFGVPMVAIPGQEEQTFNANSAASKGAAVVVEKDTMTPTTIFDALQSIESLRCSESAKDIQKHYSTTLMEHGVTEIKQHYSKQT